MIVFAGYGYFCYVLGGYKAAAFTVTRTKQEWPFLFHAVEHYCQNILSIFKYTYIFNSELIMVTSEALSHSSMEELPNRSKFIIQISTKSAGFVR